MSRQATKAAVKKSNSTSSKLSAVFVFKKENYILLALSLFIIVIGFMVMGSGDNLPFDHPRKITVAPLIVLFGIAVGVFSILYTPKEKAENQ